MPSENYKSYQVLYTSDFIAEEVARKYLKEKKEEIISFLIASDDLTILGTLRGHLFEGYCHNIIPSGSNFRIRSLESDQCPEENLTIEKCEKKIAYSSFDFTTQKCNEYYRPFSHTFGAVDAWIENIGFFQITMNANHGIYMKEMVQILSYCKHPCLYFVVPSTMFESFKKQNYLTVEGHVTKHVSKEMQDIKQFVLSIDLSPESYKRKSQDTTQSRSEKKMKLNPSTTG